VYGLSSCRVCQAVDPQSIPLFSDGCGEAAVDYRDCCAEGTPASKLSSLIIISLYSARAAASSRSSQIERPDDQLGVRPSILPLTISLGIRPTSTH